MQRVLRQLSAYNAPPLTSVPPRIARELPSFANALQGVLAAAGRPGVEVVAQITHKVIPGPGGPLLLRIYMPSASGPLPVVVYFHGGGFVIAGLDTYDATPRALANESGAIVVSVAYRQAPEYPFPAAPDDAFAAYRWVTANADIIGGDPRRVAVCGESAGGCLAAVTAVRARDARVQMPTHQLLVYPVTTFATVKPPASYRENPATIPLSTPALAWFKRYYLPSASDAFNPAASPLFTPSLKNLPPATIINADLDPLRDDGATYAERLHSAGVAVNRTLYTGVTHEFFGMRSIVAKAGQAMREASNALRSSFQ